MIENQRLIEDTIIEVLYPTYQDITTNMFLRHTLDTDYKACQIRNRFVNRELLNKADKHIVYKYKIKLRNLNGNSTKIFGLCQEIKDEYLNKKVNKMKNSYTSNETAMIEKHASEGLNSGESYKLFNAKYPGRTKDSYAHKYSKYAKSVHSKIRSKYQTYSKQEINDLILLCENHKTSADGIREFVKKYPNRSYFSVKFKVNSLKKQNKINCKQLKKAKNNVTKPTKSNNFHFYSNEEVADLKLLCETNLTDKKAVKVFIEKYPKRTYYSVCSKLRKLKKDGLVNSKINTKNLNKATSNKIVEVSSARIEDKPINNVILPFTNEESNVKDITRKIVMSYFNQNINGNSRILSLPADNFIFELDMLKINPGLKMVCVEKNQHTYSKGLVQAVNHNISYIKADCLDMLKISTNSYTNMWLDFCGVYSQYVKDTISSIASRNLLEQEGYLAITLLGARDDLSAFSGENDKIRNVDIPNDICGLVPDLKLVNIYHYLSKGGSPMRVYMFKKSVQAFEPELISLNSEKLKL